MFPIRDTIRSRTFPVINWVLIILNVLVFLYELSLGPAQLDDFITRVGLVPARLELYDPLTWYPLVTHMFVHGGWFHLLSNIWMLFIFGDNVEDRMGSGRFFSFYFLGGIFAGLMQGFFSGSPQIPSVGASGAIAAVLGAYILFYPHARVTTLVLIVFFPIFIPVPALLYLGIWFISQLYSGVLSLSTQSAMWGGVAWWAHVGGFVFGLLFARLFAAGQRARRWYPDEYYPY